MSISSVTLPTALVTGLAVLQSVLLTTLLVPWPLRVRKPLIRLILESPVAAKVIYGTKIGCIFIAVMLTDAVVSLWNMFFARRMPLAGDNSAAMERSAKWLIAQRQLAVCSMALFLSGVLYATVALHVRVLALEEELAQLQGKNVGKPIDQSKDQYEDLQDQQGPDVMGRAVDNSSKLNTPASQYQMKDKDAEEVTKSKGQ